MQDAILPGVIFSPRRLALALSDELCRLGHHVTLFTPGSVTTRATNVTADMSYFKKELDCRGDTYGELLQKHPLLFITLARQIQGELIARAYAAANTRQLDIVHIFANEEEIALPLPNSALSP